MSAASAPTQRRGRDRTHYLHIAVLLAVAAGILVGWLFPEFGKDDEATLVDDHQGAQKPGAEAPEEESVATVRG